MDEPIPTESELRRAAADLGMKYNPNDGITRAKLAKAVQATNAEIAAARPPAGSSEPAPETTAEQLARFHREVIEHGAVAIDQRLADELLVVVAGALVRRDGLVLQPRTNEENRDS